MSATNRYPASLLCLVVCVLLAGCATENTTGARRLSRYRPVAERSPSQWSDSASPRTAGAETRDERRDSSVSSKLLKKGDKLTIYIHDIPNPQELRDVIDDGGNISLPLIGAMQVEGRTTSEVEAMAEKTYVGDGYYRKINVIVVASEDSYFIRGEVKREGRYVVSPELTLLQALAEGQGYTDYAKTSEIKIIRGADTLTIDAKRIEEGKEKDPMIMPGDIIIVPRRRI